MVSAKQFLSELFPTGGVLNFSSEGAMILDGLGAPTGTYQHILPVYLPDGAPLNACVLVRDGMIVSAKPYSM